MDSSKIPSWISFMGFSHRRFKFVRTVKKILLRSGLYDFNRFVGGQHYVARINIQSNIPIILHLDDHIDNIIWWYGWYEKNPTHLFLKLLKLGDNVIDVGANIGYYSLLAASRIGSEGKVFAFEPVSSIYQRLLCNISGFKNIETKQVACGNTTGKIKIYVANNTHSSGSRISQPIEGHPLKEEVVSITKLDDALRGKNNIDLLKIDVEGYEAEVLMGAAELIRNNPQIKVFLEINKKLLGMAGTSPDKVFKILADFGLQPWKIEITGKEYFLSPQRDYWKDENLILFANKEYLPHNLLKKKG